MNLAGASLGDPSGASPTTRARLSSNPRPGGRGTMVTVLQEFRMGKLASLWETIVGRNPKQAVIENLRHFKALAETGEIPRTQGQPHGPRGIDRGVKKSMYGEETMDAARAESQSELNESFSNLSSEIGVIHESALLDGKWQGRGSQRRRIRRS